MRTGRARGASRVRSLRGQPSRPAPGSIGGGPVCFPLRKWPDRWVLVDHDGWGSCTAGSRQHVDGSMAGFEQERGHPGARQHVGRHCMGRRRAEGSSRGPAQYLLRKPHVAQVARRAESLCCSSDPVVNARALCHLGIRVAAAPRLPPVRGKILRPCRHLSMGWYRVTGPQDDTLGIAKAIGSAGAYRSHRSADPSIRRSVDPSIPRSLDPVDPIDSSILCVRPGAGGGARGPGRRRGPPPARRRPSSRRSACACPRTTGPRRGRPS